MADEPYGRGLVDTMEIQRRWNEADRLLQEHVRRCASEDPTERMRQILEVRQRAARIVDELLATQEKR